jgi:hypothetical protein
MLFGFFVALFAKFSARPDEAGARPRPYLCQGWCGFLSKPERHARMFSGARKKQQQEACSERNAAKRGRGNELCSKRFILLSARAAPCLFFYCPCSAER